MRRLPCVRPPRAAACFALCCVALAAATQPDPAHASEVSTLCDALREPPGPVREQARQELERLVLQGIDHDLAAVLLDRIFAWRHEAGQTARTLLPGTPSLLDMVDALASANQETPALAQLQETLRRCIAWVSLCGTAEQVAQLAPLLHDRHLAPDALRGMARTPGAAVTRALLDATETTRGATRRHLFAALGMREDAAVATVLAQQAARETNPDDAWAIIEALSRLGVPPVEAVRLPSGVTSRDAARFANANLRAALMVAAQGDSAKAIALLQRYLDMYALRHQISAALLGLARLDAPDLTRAALGFVSTPGVRETVIQVLTQSTDPRLEDTLTRAWPVTDPSMQAAILEILSARASAKATPLIRQAAGSGHVELRVTAARLLGQTPNPDDLLALAAAGAPWTRARALADYLALAEWNAVSGHEEAAVRMFLTVLDGPLPPEAHLRALRGIEAHGGPALLDRVERLLYDPALEAAAARTLAALTARIPDEEERADRLRHLARDTRHTDAAALAALALQMEGGEMTGIARDRGYLLEWELLGPMPRINPDGFDDPPFSLAGEYPPRQVTVDDQTHGWTAHTATGIPAVVMLESMDAGRAYAVAEAPVRDWLPVQIFVACTGGGRLWINGEPVWQAFGTGLDPNKAEPVLYSLEPGRNRLVLELVNEQGPWGFWLRLAERRSGVPIDPTLLTMPDDGTRGVGLRPGDLLPMLDRDAP